MSNTEKDSNPTIVNPKPDDQKHYENTTEISHPHTSTDHPNEHVDTLTFGEGGKHESEHDTDGIEDPNLIEMGREQEEMHNADKESKSDDEDK